ncbi:hypothetical protein [Mycolicibacterium hippocampi]|uniref:Scaffolding protein n=1 Tax=Mycolicibacterium hippocampi TaxID=659824 RepID=A0A850PTA2_9MYCO|nr:hypothetical protein [Mycolicibacterium hippocampi]NVN51310.1 hypothetical protein [Mycolicibacterium hippocampi]
MSEIDTETIDAAIPESAVDEPVDAPEGDDAAETPKANREARYRVERNQARDERNALAARLEQLQTAELHRLAGEHLAAPEDISLSGKPLSEFLTPEGWVDHQAVEAAAKSVIGSRPGLSKHSPATDRSQGHGFAAATAQPSFSDLLKS